MTGSDNRRTDAPTQEERERFSVWLKMTARAGRVVVGAVFAIAALQKASQPEETLRALLFAVEFFAIPPGLAIFLFFALIGVEVMLATALFFDIVTRRAVRWSLVLLGIFLAWLLFLLITGTKIGCGCGLRLGWLARWDDRGVAIARNIGLCILLVPSLLLRAPTSDEGELVQHGSSVPA